MKAMSWPCRLASRSLFHTSSTCLNNKPDSSTSLTKPSSQQQDLDFLKATDILFAEEDPKRKKKFGWDFHLWQAFVACLPSVAVYLTAQYARYDMRRMEAERDREASEKRKIEEEKQEEEACKLPGFRTIHERLDKLEGKISDIESKRHQSAPALQGGKPAVEREIEKVESNVRVTIADSSMERKSDARGPAPMTKGEPVEHSKGPMKAPEVKPREGRLPVPSSKAEPNEKVEADEGASKGP